jgi:hypothetical protein
MSFWKRTLGIFRNEGAVRIELRGGKRVIGELETIGENSCSVRMANGATVLVEFDQILSVEK